VEIQPKYVILEDCFCHVSSPSLEAVTFKISAFLRLTWPLKYQSTVQQSSTATSIQPFTSWHVSVTSICR